MDSGDIRDRLVVLGIGVAQVRYPDQSQGRLVETVELTVESTEVNTPIDHRWSASHPGEAMGIRCVIAQIPIKGIDNGAGLNVDLV